MKPTTILPIIIILLIPMLSIANVPEHKPNSKEIEIIDIQTLIEKAKNVPSEERAKIENQIKKRIAQAHREKPFK